MLKRRHSQRFSPQSSVRIRQPRPIHRLEGRNYKREWDRRNDPRRRAREILKQQGLGHFLDQAAAGQITLDNVLALAQSIRANRRTMKLLKKPAS
jgi:hypothetical protein